MGIKGILTANHRGPSADGAGELLCDCSGSPSEQKLARSNIESMNWKLRVAPMTKPKVRLALLYVFVQIRGRSGDDVSRSYHNRGAQYRSRYSTNVQPTLSVPHSIIQRTSDYGNGYPARGKKAQWDDRTCLQYVAIVTVRHGITKAAAVAYQPFVAGLPLARHPPEPQEARLR